tara:strand:+ start:12383 stop:12862 length:480 start_codon:yes stop_codon:yes gene_type:complete
MSEDLPRIPIPGPEAETTEKMVFLQEQIVNFLRQYSMPLLEVSLVFSKYTRQLTDALEVQARNQGESLPAILSEPWPILGEQDGEFTQGPPLETLLGNLDDDRMDILDTILRSAMNATEIPLVDALMQLRQWEHLARNQLASAKGAGQLFSPLEIPDDW